MKKWISDNGDGTYTNPILYTDYSDPDAIRVGSDYYMTASTFCNTPGLPILHSKDLVNWQVIGYALENIPYDSYEAPLHGKGVWAPSIRYHEGEFIIFFPMPDEGIFVTKATNPKGPWSEPIAIFEGAGWIDPCPFWDEDGKAYMCNGFAKSRIGFNSILQMVEISPDCTKLIGEPVHVFDGNNNGQRTIEGPKVYKRNGYYYIFAPAGGVKQGWQLVLRSKNIYGPYEQRIVCEQKDSTINGPHQGAWVDTVTGEDWFIHFQDVYSAGRLTILQPMRWVDDWPVIGISEDGDTCGKPVVTYRKPNIESADICIPDVDDDFDKDSLGLQWQWNANHSDAFYKMCPETSEICLNSMKKADTIANQPNLLIQKWAAPEFSAVAKCSVRDMADGDIAGLINMGVAYGAVAVRKTGDSFSIVTLEGQQTFDHEVASSEDIVKTLLDNVNLNECNQDIYFKYSLMQVPSAEYNTDGKFRFEVPKEIVTLSYSLDGKNFRPSLSIDAKAGRWVGVKEGFFIVNEKGISGGKFYIDYFK